MFMAVLLVSGVTTIISSIVLGNLERYTVTDLNIVFTFSFSLTYSLFNINNYTKYSIKIMNNEVEDRNLIVNLYEIMKKMHWLLEYHNDKQIVFKSRLYQSPWREYLVINIRDNDIEIIGCKYYLQKVLKKAGVEK